MKGWVFGLAGALAFALPASASAASKALTQPDWVQRPQADDLDRNYPEIAQVLGVEGFAALACRVDAFGRLERCTAAEEAPAGFGFGRAAVRMAPLFRMRPMTVNGAPVDGVDIRIPIRFRLPTPPVAALPDRVDPRALDLARRFIELMQLTQALVRAHDEKADELEFLASDDIPPEVRGDAAAALRVSVRAHEAEMRDALAGASLAVFSQEELKAITDGLGGPAQAVLRQDPNRLAVFEMLDRDMRRQISAKARSRFCGRHDCDVTGALQLPVEASIQAATWVETPSQAEVDARWPGLARAMGLGGAVRLRCIVNATATLEACQAAAEAPAGLTFGLSALSLTSRFRLDPKLMALGAEKESVAIMMLFGQPGAAERSDAPEPFRPPEPRSASAFALARQMMSREDSAAAAAIDEQARKALLTTPAGADPATYADAVNALRSATHEAMVSALDGRARTYAALYSEDELAAAAAFKNSAAARALAEKGPTILEASRGAAEVIEARIQTDARLSFCKVHSCAAPPPSAPVKPAP